MQAFWFFDQLLVYDEHDKRKNSERNSNSNETETAQSSSNFIEMPFLNLTVRQNPLQGLRSAA